MGGVAPLSPTSSRPIERTSVEARAILVVDCGSTFLKAALLARVEDRFRLLARAQSPATIAPPANDVMIGLREAVARLEQITGRKLLRNGELLMPQSDDGDGVDAVALSTSAGGPLRLLATGPGRDALAGLLQRAVGGLFVQLDALPPLAEQGTGGPERRQLVSSVRATQPHAIVVVGSAFAPGSGALGIEESAGSIAAWL
ncbi:MAG TPA: glutamate mutase L, partial [Ktedonobacterales bacterium]|nr:glutamate mutase L [Ktedonobacterales bacterium]